MCYLAELADFAEFAVATSQYSTPRVYFAQYPSQYNNRAIYVRVFKWKGTIDA